MFGRTTTSSCATGSPFESWITSSTDTAFGSPTVSIRGRNCITKLNEGLELENSVVRLENRPRGSKALIVQIAHCKPLVIASPRAFVTKAADFLASPGFIRRTTPATPSTPLASSTLIVVERLCAYAALFAHEIPSATARENTRQMSLFILYLQRELVVTISGTRLDFVSRW